MPDSHRHPQSVSSRDVQEYLQRQSRLCDSRIEDAFMRLSSRYGESRAPSPLDRRALSSSSVSLPSRKLVVQGNAPRPASAQERRAAEKPRGILKKASSSSPTSRSGGRSSSESPDAWFQRVMHVKRLSPLDLCDVFSYGDARKHPLVPLSHVCEVLFDLDPDSTHGTDPVTERMEEFMYQFATAQGGEIVVNIKDALRALDIWQSRVVSSGARVTPSPVASDPQTKAVVLESKNRKLLGVISSLQDANLRLSRQLDSALSPKAAEEAAAPAWSPRSRAAMRPSSVEVSPVKVKATATPKTPAFAPSTRLQVVNLHEQELIEIASKLQFTGVKRLEDLLVEGDREASGFVDLKQLRWLLADEFELRISEVELIEVCMGMNFNPHAQLDYKEFVDVLLDILIYELPDVRESAKRKSLVRLGQYLRSGFPPGREGARQLLDALCAQHDVHGDQCISVAAFVRVLHVDLVRHHALELPFPLEEHETIQLARPFIQRDAQATAPEGLLCYPELLDTILGPFPSDFNAGRDDAKLVKRALQWGFWRGIHTTLCGGHAVVEHKVLAQLGKILAKVDAEQTFTISTRHLKRIFERHVGSDDMEVLAAVLAPEDSDSAGLVRYDVLLKLVFGSPVLSDDRFFDSQIRAKLSHEQERLQAFLSELLASKGAAHRLSLQDFYDAFIVQAEAYPLAMSAMLFLFAMVDSSHEGRVEVKALRSVLSTRCWRAREREDGAATRSEVKGGALDLEALRELVGACCSAYDLQSALDELARKTKGWVSLSAVVKELAKMLHDLGVAGIEQSDLRRLVQGTCARHPTPTAPAPDAVRCDAFFDALFDWDALIRALKLPHSRVEIEGVLERFDWEHVGAIRCEDWNKAYRLLAQGNRSLADWEVRVLQRRFPAKCGPRERAETIDYGHLLVYLLELQQRQAREQLQSQVVGHFQQKFAAKHGRMSTGEMERLFRCLDADGKGYFNAADLRAYLTKEFSRADREAGAEAGSVELLSSDDAVASVMRLLTGGKGEGSSSGSAGSTTVVTLERFHELAGSLGASSTVSTRGPRRNRPSSRGAAQLRPLSARTRHEQDVHGQDECQTISSLRVLELQILEIASDFADLKGNILPTRAFRYLSQGPASASESGRPTPPSSPVRRSPSVSVTARSKRRELEASPLDPLTPTKLQQLLQLYHRADVSIHLISQFFLHIGSPSKYFLDLVHFSQWAAPLSVELQGKVRGVVRQMIVKGKGGGGRVDLDRFLAQLQRKLQDSPRSIAGLGHSESPPLQWASTSLLLSKLHQLNIPLHRQELMALLRHFGMEDDLEAVDYALLLQRVYELNSACQKSAR